MWPHQLIIDDKHHPQSVLFIFSTIGFKAHYELVTDKGQSTTRDVTFFSINENDHVLISWIQHYIPWSSTKTIILRAIEHRISSLIQTFITNNNLGEYYIESAQQMEVDKDTFIEKTKEITYSCSPGTSCITAYNKNNEHIICFRYLYQIFINM